MSEFHYIDIREREYSLLIKLMVTCISSDELANSSRSVTHNPFEYHDLSVEGSGIFWKLKDNWKHVFPNINFWEEKIDSSDLSKCMNTKKLTPSTVRDQQSSSIGVSSLPAAPPNLTDSVKALMKTNASDSAEPHEINLSHYIDGHANTRIPARTIFLQLQQDVANSPFVLDDWLELTSISKSGSLIFRHALIDGLFSIPVKMFRIRDVITPIMQFSDANEISTPPHIFI